MSVKLPLRMKKTRGGKDKPNTHRSGRRRENSNTTNAKADKKKPPVRKSPPQIQRSKSWRENLAIWDAIG
jgi:hypothetical protein